MILLQLQLPRILLDKLWSYYCNSSSSSGWSWESVGQALILLQQLRISVSKRFDHQLAFWGNAIRPDNVSMSSWERPTAEKEFVSCSTVKVGSGSAATASVAMDTNPSYLPAGTDQVAPPACKKQKRSVQNPAMEELWSVPRRSRTARFVWRFADRKSWKKAAPVCASTWRRQNAWRVLSLLPQRSPGQYCREQRMRECQHTRQFPGTRLPPLPWWHPRHRTHASWSWVVLFSRSLVRREAQNHHNPAHARTEQLQELHTHNLQHESSAHCSISYPLELMIEEYHHRAPASSWLQQEK